MQLNTLQQQSISNHFFLRHGIMLSSNDFEAISSALKIEVIDPTPEQVEAIVCSVMGIDDIRERDRKTKYITARQLLCYILNVHLKLHYAHIGGLLSQDRTTIINTVRRAKDYIETDDNFCDKLNECLIRMSIKNSNK